MMTSLLRSLEEQEVGLGIDKRGIDCELSGPSSGSDMLSLDATSSRTRSSYLNGASSSRKWVGLGTSDVIWADVYQVTCNKNPTHENSLWYIETNNHAQRAL